MELIDKAAVVAEIERRRRDWWFGSSTEAKFKREECDDILSLLDTFEVKDDMDTIHPIEDVVSNDHIAKSLEISRHEDSRIGETLEEAAKKVGQKYFPDEDNIWARPNYEAVAAANAFKEGAKWQEEQMEKNRIEHCDNITEEQYNLETSFIDGHIKKYHRIPTILDAIEYGMSLKKGE